MSRETVVWTASKPGCGERVGNLRLRRELVLSDEPEDCALALELLLHRCIVCTQSENMQRLARVREEDHGHVRHRRRS